MANTSFLDYKYTQPSDNFVRVPILPEVIQNHNYNDIFYITLYRLSQPTPKERYIDLNYHSIASLGKYVGLNNDKAHFQIKTYETLNLITVTDDKIILTPLLDKDVVRLRKDLIDKLLAYNLPWLISVYAYLYEHRDPEPVSAISIAAAFGYTPPKKVYFRELIEKLYVDRYISLRFVREHPWTVLSTPR